MIKIAATSTRRSEARVGAIKASSLLKIMRYRITRQDLNRFIPLIL